MDKFTCIFVLLMLSVKADADGICSALVEPQNYPCQEHKVTTQDGYILSLQNIGHGRSGKAGGERPPVLLQHGVLVDAVTWLLNPPDQSLPLILADEGFDVWLVNTRGTKYSRGHASLSPNDAPYWDWSWDELVARDLPATLHYVYGQTGRKIHFIGHSQGTLIGLAALLNGQLASALRSVGLLCPIAYISHLTSPLARAIGENLLSHTSHWLKVHEFNPTGPEVINLMLDICKKKGVKNCLKLLKSPAGENCCLNSSSLDVFLQHEPQSSSTKNVIHLAQSKTLGSKLRFDAIVGDIYLRFQKIQTNTLMKDGMINKFDYGDEKTNKKHYGAARPPSYDMSKIAVDFPLFIAHGGADSMSVRKDVKLLLHSLGHHQRDKLVVEYREEYGHGDYIMGVNARQVVYDSLIAFLRLW